MRRTVLMATGWSGFILAVYLFLGFRPALPDTIGEGEICFRCRQVITHARLAAEMLDGSLPTKYRTSGCMARYVAEHPGTAARYFVTDYRSGTLIDAERAWFVPVLINDRTGERDYQAYLSRAAAEAMAGATDATAIRWATVVRRAQS